MKVHCFLFLAVSYIFGDSLLKIMDYKDTKAKCRHMKILTCKGTLRQVFIKVYGLEIQSVMLVFSTQLCELLPLSPYLWFNSSPLPPSLCGILYTRIQ